MDTETPPPRCWICDRLIGEPPARDLSGQPVHQACKPMADEAIRWDESKRIRLSSEAPEHPLHD
jgi:hypothetical protein